MYLLKFRKYTHDMSIIMLCSRMNIIIIIYSGFVLNEKFQNEIMRLEFTLQAVYSKTVRFETELKK